MAAGRRAEQILDRVYRVGGHGLTGTEDCLCYLVCGAQANILIDAGAGPSAMAILDLARQACGGEISDLLLTHAHIDHIGGAADIRTASGCRVLIHRDDAGPLSRGDRRFTAADWYGLHLARMEPDVELNGGESLDLGDDEELRIVHTPGHTPGSVAAWLDRDGQRVLFGQDIHGPFSVDFGSDLDAWAQSMARLRELKADILAEGHYGVYSPAKRVREFIDSQLAANGR